MGFIGDSTAVKCRRGHVLVKDKFERAYFEVKMLGSLADPGGHGAANFGADGGVGEGRHPATFDAAAVDVERDDAAADADGDVVPLAVGQLVVERFVALRAEESVEQSDLILGSDALQL